MKKFSIIKGALILTFSYGAIRLIGFVFRIYLSDRLGAEGMGLYQLVMSLYTLGASLTTLSISSVISKLVSESLATRNHARVQKIMRVSLALTVSLGCMVSLVIFLFAPEISRVLLKEERTVLSLYCLAPAFPFIGISACLNGYFYGKQHVVAPTSGQFVEQAVRIAVCMLLLVRFASLGLAYATAAAYIGVTLGEAISCLYIAAAYFLKRNRPPRAARLLSPVLPTVLSLCIPTALSGTLNAVLKMAENVLIPSRLMLFGESTDTAMATFGMLKGMVMPLIFLPTSFLGALGTTLLPVVSEAHAVGKAHRVSRAVARALQLASLMGILIVAVFWLFSNEIGVLLYHDQAVGEMLRTMSRMCPLFYLQVVLVSLLSGLGKQMFLFVSNLVESGLKLVLIYLFLPKYGFGAYITALMIANTVGTLLNLFCLLRLTRVSFDILGWLILPGLSAAAAGLMTRFLVLCLWPSLPLLWRLVSSVGLMTLLYTLGLFLFGCITPKEIHAVLPLG